MPSPVIETAIGPTTRKMLNGPGPGKKPSRRTVMTSAPGPLMVTSPASGRQLHPDEDRAFQAIGEGDRVGPRMSVGVSDGLAEAGLVVERIERRWCGS